MAYLTSLAISPNSSITRTYKFHRNSVDLDSNFYSIGREGNIKTHRLITCISRLHCSLQRKGNGKWAIKDLNSHCGTKVNSVEIGKRDVILQHEDVITIGSGESRVDFFYHQD